MPFIYFLLYDFSQFYHIRASEKIRLNLNPNIAVGLICLLQKDKEIPSAQELNIANISQRPRGT